MRVTREKAAENRARIVETTSRLFREKGFDDVGLDAIMKEAGLTYVRVPVDCDHGFRWKMITQSGGR